MNAFPPLNPVEWSGELAPGPADDARQLTPTIRPAAVNRPAVQPPRTLRVLCVDDDEQVLESMKACLGFFAHEVKVASGGKVGIELFCTAILKSEPYDVVITDMNMPDVNGYAVAQTIKAESPGTPVVLMTGANNTTRDGGSISASVDAVVTKPPRMKELNELLLRVVRPA